MQNDFITGSLAVPGAIEIVGQVQDYMDWARNKDWPVALTMCQHPKKHCSFIENGGTWPAHCVKGTWGQRLQIGIEAMVQQDEEDYPLFMKGREIAVDQYSGFDNTSLNRYLINNKVKSVEVCGLARDYCVDATVQAALKLGYEVNVLEHLCRSVMQRE
jgi:nicotinamidase/pyrazinamidase